MRKYGHLVGYVGVYPTLNKTCLGFLMARIRIKDYIMTDGREFAVPNCIFHIVGMMRILCIILAFYFPVRFRH